MSETTEQRAKASGNKTQPTDVPVEAFLATLPQRRQDEGREIVAMMSEISGEPPVMWGPSIIGFGTTTYRLASGREGDMGLLGFSPRKAALTFYFMEGFEQHADLLERLGKHRTSVGCLYINKLGDVDLDVLRAMIERSYEHQLARARREN